jgi:hypothetical protein
VKVNLLQVGIALDERLGVERQKVIGWCAPQSVAEKKAGGVIPTTVKGFSSILNTLPITEGSNPYLSCPNLWLITAAGGAPAWSSLVVSSRPAYAPKPNIVK